MDKFGEIWENRKFGKIWKKIVLRKMKNRKFWKNLEKNSKFC